MPPRCADVAGLFRAEEASSGGYGQQRGQKGNKQWDSAGHRSERAVNRAMNDPKSVSIHRVTPGKPATASCDHGNSAIIRQSPITANPLHIRLQNWNLGTRPEVVVIVSKIFLHFM